MSIKLGINGFGRIGRMVLRASLNHPDVEVADVMLALNKASVSFKTLAEVRNRLVSAYQDIMNMPV